MKNYKATLINMNISDYKEEIEGNESELLESINLCIDATKNLLDDNTSIYEGYNLKMIKEEINEEDIQFLIKNPNEAIVIAEDTSDKDYCVYFKIEEV